MALVVPDHNLTGPPVDCALPGNYNDLDLSSEGLSDPRPDDIATEVTFEVVKFKIALQVRGPVRLQQDPKAHPLYGSNAASMRSSIKARVSNTI